MSSHDLVVGNGMSHYPLKSCVYITWSFIHVYGCMRYDEKSVTARFSSSVEKSSRFKPSFMPHLCLIFEWNGDKTNWLSY